MGYGPSQEALGSKLAALCDVRVGKSLDSMYTVGDVIGEGRFSKVYEGLRLSSNNKVALKEIDQGALEEDEEALEMLEAEVVALRRATSADHVVKLHEVVAADDAVWLAMERVPGRELFELVEEKGALPNALVSSLMKQLLTALEALARLGVVHRDVKPENMMVSEAEGAPTRLTLIDFGYAALLSVGDGASGGEQQLSGVAGSPEYAAPEVLSWLEVEADETGIAVGEPYDAGCDVWSVGVTTHVLLSAELPFELPEDCTEESLVAAARSAKLTFRRPEWAGDAMADARDFVTQCMSVAREERPSARALLDHPWVTPPTKGANDAYVEMLEETIAVETAKLSVGDGDGGS